MNILKTIFSLNFIEKLFNNIASILLIGIMLLVVTDVTGRYIVKKPLQGTMEITEFVMVALVFFSLAYTQAIKAHINVTLIVEMVSPKVGYIFESFTCFVGMVIFGLITWQGYVAAKEAWEFQETTFGLIPFPLFPAKVTVPIGCFIFTFRFMIDFITALKHLTEKESV